MSKVKIVCIVGATASGKTDIGVKLAQRLNTEIVSADSIQVYKHLDIGSAKPDLAEQCGITHHLIDCIEPTDDKFSVGRYRELAANVIYDIAGKNKLPVVVGGTGLYINSLTYPLNFAEVEADFALREYLRKIENEAPGKLHQMLYEIDPVTAERLHKNDTKRLIRAIEVYKVSGKPLSEHGNDFRNNASLECEFSPVMIGITMPREHLYERINKRVDIMMQKGLLEETERLIKMNGFSRTLPAFQALGYKQLIGYLLDKTPDTLEECVENIKRETRRFAKRQLTWFRRDTRIHWVDITAFDDKEKAVDEICEIIGGDVSG